jgi:ubiquinone/menaquinone biosynthesis C-methylase UbiE
LQHYLQLLKTCGGAPGHFQRVLDFGCGVGRLSVAWAKRAELVSGVDISSPMVERGRALLASVPNVQLQVNEAGHLACFKDNTFDVVFSHACLQHMPWLLAAGYLKEFARVCAPGGWVIFSLPARVLSSTWGPRLRQKAVDLLPFGLGRRYRHWRHGSEAVFEMHYTSPESVERVLSDAGLKVLRREPDNSAGEQAESFVYLAGKPQWSSTR